CLGLRCDQPGDALEQLRQRIRFNNIVDRTGLGEADGLFNLAEGGNKQKWLDTKLWQSSQKDILTAHVGQTDIADNNILSRRAQRFERLLPRLPPERLVAF